MRSMLNRVTVGAMAACLVVAQIIMPTQAALAYTAPTDVVTKVQICHASSSNTNPYQSNEINVQAADPTHGHSAHTGPVWDPTLNDKKIGWGDIIPPFSYTGNDGTTQNYSGLNWTDGQAIYANDCAIPITTPVNTIAAPVATLNVKCGPNNDSYSLTGYDQTKMTLTSESTWANSSKTLVFTIIAANYTFTDGQTTATVTLTDSATACPVVKPCTPDRNVTEPLVTNQKMFATYTDGSQSNNYEFIDGGVRIWIENGKNAWYHSFNTPLSQIGAPSMDYTSEGGLTPGLQIIIDFNNDGTPDGTLVGESAYSNNWWLTNGSQAYIKAGAPHVGTGNGSPYYGTLDEWLTAFPQAQVKYVGYSLGTAAAGKGVLHSLTFGCHTWNFGKAPREAQPCTIPREQAIEPRIKNTGTYSFESDGLHFNTPADADQVNFWLNTGATNLSDINSMSYKTLRLEKSGGSEWLVPGYFLKIDFDGDVTTSDDQGYIAYEPLYNTQAGVADPTAEGNWQIWDVIDGGNAVWYGDGIGSEAAPTRWSDIVAMYPDAIALNLIINQGSGNPDLYTVVQNVNFDCATFSFHKPGQGGGGETPTTPPVTTSTTPGMGTAGANILASSALPALLPETGGMSMNGTVVALAAALATYGAVYFAVNKRRYE